MSATLPQLIADNPLHKELSKDCQFARISYPVSFDLVQDPEPVQTVRTKAEMYRRFHRGEFGNHGPMWETWEEYDASGYGGLIAIRTRRVAAGRCQYNLSRAEAALCRQRFRAEGYRDSELHYSAMIRDDRVLLQGEVQRTWRGLDLLASTQRNCPMRPALRDHAFREHGLRASQRLQEAMDGPSWDCLNELLDIFDGHVVEFSTLDVSWGVLGWNTVFWEVRAY